MAEPVTLEEAKARLGVRSIHRDAELQGLIPAARLQIEGLAGHLLVQREVTQYFASYEYLDGLELNYWPVVSIGSVAIRDSAGIMQPVVGYRLLGDIAPARVFPAVATPWPQYGSPPGALVTLTAGYAPGEVPEDLLVALFLLVGHWFENHEAVIAGASAAAIELPLGVKDICSQYRLPGIS